MKRLLAAAFFLAAVSLSLGGPAAAQTTRTYTLGGGATLIPASPSYDPSGAPVYTGCLVAGQLGGATPGTFTLSVAFRATSVIDEGAGIYAGVVLSPYSSFVVTQASGRKSVSTSGTIDSGAVTYRLVEGGMAEVISVSSDNLTVWEGSNKRRRAVGSGTLRYGTETQGAGTIVLYF